MRPKTFNKKLVFNKQTVSHLNSRDMSVVQGGDLSGLTCPVKGCTISCWGTCISCQHTCPATECDTECGC